MRDVRAIIREALEGHVDTAHKYGEEALDRAVGDVLQGVAGAGLEVLPGPAAWSCSWVGDRIALHEMPTTLSLTQDKWDPDFFTCIGNDSEDFFWLSRLHRSGLRGLLTYYAAKLVGAGPAQTEPPVDHPEVKVVYVTENGGFFLTQEALAMARRLSGDDSWNEDDVPRHDPRLVQAVEALGEAAGSTPLGVKTVSGLYRLQEDDGWETVETPETLIWIDPINGREISAADALWEAFEAGYHAARGEPAPDRAVPAVWDAFQRWQGKGGGSAEG